MNFPNLLPSTINLPGVFAIILVVLVSEGPGFWGGGLVLDSLFAGKLQKKQGFGRDAWIAKLIVAMSSVYFNL